jgi:hypothetical protein
MLVSTLRGVQPRSISCTSSPRYASNARALGLTSRFSYLIFVKRVWSFLTRARIHPPCAPRSSVSASCAHLCVLHRQLQVRGYKKIVKFFGHEASDFHPTVDRLEKMDPSDTEVRAVRAVSPPRALRTASPPRALRAASPPRALRTASPPRALRAASPPRALRVVSPPRALRVLSPPLALRTVSHLSPLRRTTRRDATRRDATLAACCGPPLCPTLRST